MRQTVCCARLRSITAARCALLFAVVVVLPGLTAGCADQSSETPASATVQTGSNNLKQVGLATGVSQPGGEADGKAATPRPKNRRSSEDHL